MSKPTVSAWAWALSRQASRARRARVKAGTVASKSAGFIAGSKWECHHRMFLFHVMGSYSAVNYLRPPLFDMIIAARIFF